MGLLRWSTKGLNQKRVSCGEEGFSYFTSSPGAPRPPKLFSSLQMPYGEKGGGGAWQGRAYRVRRVGNL